MYPKMGVFRSKLSDMHTEILHNSTGLTVEELRPLFETIPTYVFHDRNEFQKHAVPDSIAFLVILGKYVVNTKSTYGGKGIYYY